MARSATDVAAVRSCQKLLPPYVTEPTPGSSKAEPVGNGSSEATDLRRRGKTYTIEQAVGERSDSGDEDNCV